MASVLDPDNDELGPLIRTKLSAPAHTGLTVHREHLLALLSAQPAPRLTLINAPAGYGKTMTLAQWLPRLRSAGAHVAWLTLDSHDNDPASFLAYVIAALCSAGVDLRELLPAARSRLMGTQHHAVVSTLINALSRERSAIYLILDDYHQAMGQAVDDLLDLLVRFAPEGLRIVVATRERPACTLAALRTRGELREITTKELQFSRLECDAYFGFNDRTTATLAERSGGWPVALQLGRLWLEQHEAYAEDAALRALSGSSADFADYLAEQVFAGLDENLKSALLPISLLERFNGDLVNAVTGRDDGWALVTEIERRNLFVTVVDAGGRWLAFHQLFREFLIGRLAQQAQWEPSRIHIAAAQWFVRARHFSEAIAHACRSGDAAYLSGQLDAAGGWAVALVTGVHAFAPLRTWPVDSAGRFPQIGFVIVYLLLQHGELAQARALFNRVTGSMAAGHAGELGPELKLAARVLESVLHLYEEQVLNSAETEDLMRSAAALQDTRPLMPAIATALACYGAYHRAEHPRCIALGRRALDLSERLGIHYAAVYIRIYLALSHLELGQLATARECLIEARQLGGDRFGRQSNLVAFTNVMLAEIAYEQGDVEDARSLLDDGFALTRTSGGWLDVLASGHATRARLRVADGHAARALDELEIAALEAEAEGQRQLAHLLTIQRARVLLHFNRVEEAERILTAQKLHDLLDQEGQYADPTTWRIAEPLITTLAKALIEKGDVSKAIALLERSFERAAKHGCLRRVVDSSILLAQAHDRAGAEKEARAAMCKALEIAAGNGSRRSFIDESGRLEGLLERMVTDRALAGPTAGFAADLLREMRGIVRKAPLDARANAPATGLSGLSRRESDILKCLAAGMSNKDMARALRLSEGTVKVHRKRLYRKLKASSRFSALVTARRRGILTDLSPS